MSIPAHAQEAIEVSRFAHKDAADRLAAKLSESGYEPFIRETAGPDRQNIYQVFIHAKKDEQPDNQKTGAEISGASATAETSRTSAMRNVTWDDIETKGSYVHGALTVTGLYTDNAYNAKRNKKSDFTFFLSPEIWLNAPRIDQKALPSLLSPSAPGGRDLGELRSQQLRKFQGFLHYGMDIPISGKNSPYSEVMHRFTGSARYSGSRFSLLVGDQFERNYHEREAGMITGSKSDVYTGNLAVAGLAYHSGNKLQFNAAYSNFLVDYKSKESRFRNRVDNKLRTSAHYKISPRSSIYLEYELLKIVHGKDSTLDSREHHVFAGVDWEITAKSRGLIKAGYGKKDFSKISEKRGYLFLEGQLDHKLTSRTGLGLSIYQKTDESNVSTYAYILTTGAEGRLSHIVTSRMTLAFRIAYIRDSYRGNLTAGTTDQPDSIITQAGADLTYEFSRWLKGSIGYLYTRKDSDNPGLEYVNNTWFFRLQGAL